MIDLYYWPTPNGWKISIMLEECATLYKLIPVDIGAGDQFKPEFLKISPNNRMPAIVDHSPVDGGAPLSVFESGAILEYLATKEQKFIPPDPRGRVLVLQWVHWQMANLGPMMGNANHFVSYAPKIEPDLSLLEYGKKRFLGEVDRLCGVLNRQLSSSTHVAMNELTIADIAIWSWAHLSARILGEDAWKTFPHVKEWTDRLGERRGFQRGRLLGEELAKTDLTPEEEQRRRELLFNQSSESLPENQLHQ
ncbi:MAG: glutathione S-transferase N-terminal domain-containing protein [Gammaproteobacteria bacterium]|nr:glutathione S-transferase N-terminal domain-containing protein [Gammaproteobacteria bacterium]